MRTCSLFIAEAPPTMIWNHRQTSWSLAIKMKVSLNQSVFCHEISIVLFAIMIAE